MISLKKQVLQEWFPGTLSEWAKVIGVAGFFAYFFYRSAAAVLPMVIPAVYLVLTDRRKVKRERERCLLQQFGECILSVAGAVKAGYAAENAFLESMKDMEMMYGAESQIMEQLVQIKGGLGNHLTLEALLQDMGQRTQLQEIREFAEIFAITKRNGGSLAEIIQMTAQNIRAKVTVEEEIHTLLTSRKLEQKVMNLTPFLLVLYLQVTTPGYFDLFFQDITGRMMMTGFLIWYMVAYGLSEAILRKACSVTG